VIERSGDEGSEWLTPPLGWNNSSQKEIRVRSPNCGLSLNLYELFRRFRPFFRLVEETDPRAECFGAYFMHFLTDAY